MLRTVNGEQLLVVPDPCLQEGGGKARNSKIRVLSHSPGQLRLKAHSLTASSSLSETFVIHCSQAWGPRDHESFESGKVCQKQDRDSSALDFAEVFSGS